MAQGERIIETEYSEQFQISRTPIREALRMLELEGLVVSNAKGGVLVKKFTQEEIVEVYKIRIALEGIILEEVIQKATEDDIKTIEKILEDTKAEIENKNLEKDFHDKHYHITNQVHQLLAFLSLLFVIFCSWSCISLTCFNTSTPLFIFSKLLKIDFLSFERFISE